MIATSQETQRTVALEMVQSIAEAVGGPPDDTQAARDARARLVVHAVLGLRPRDPLEIMFAGMVVSHAYLIQDSARDALRETDARLKARTKATTVALDRAMLNFLGELHRARARRLPDCEDADPVAAVAADVTAAAVPVVEPVTEAVSPVGVQVMAPVGGLAAAATVPVAPAPAPVAAASSPAPRVVSHRPAAKSAVRPLADRAVPEPPVPLLPPLRTTGSSIVAMLTALSPPVVPYWERSAAGAEAGAGMPSSR